MDQKSVVQLKEKLTLENTFGIALDIDETISNTFEYWISVLLTEFENPEKLTTQDFFKKYKLVQNVPYWDKDKLNKFLDDYRECPDMHFNPEPFENILDEVSKLNVCCYITARPEKLTNITIEWLKKHRFPDVPVILKPDEIHYNKGNEWKARVLEYLYPQVNGIVDDNPKLGKEICDTYKGKIYLLSFDNHENEKHNVIACKDWNKVHLEVLKHNSRI